VRLRADEVTDAPWFKPVLAVAILGLIVSIAFEAGWFKSPPTYSTLLPGFNGEQNGIDGYQPNQELLAPLGQANLPTPPGACSYSWSNPTSNGITVTAVSPSQIFGVTQPCWVPPTGSDTIFITNQNNLIPNGSPQKVSYYVQNPSNPKQWMFVTGQVNEYQYNINLGIQGGSSGAWGFQGDTVWFVMGSSVWNQAAVDPANGTIIGKTFETPLYGVVTAFTHTNWGTSNCALCQIGTTISFYSAPNTNGPCSTFVDMIMDSCNPSSPPTGLNGTLHSVYAPDSRMQSVVYYPMQITQLQGNCVLGEPALGCEYPQGLITVTVYTLQIGEYILLNPSKQDLTSNPTSGCTSLVCAYNAAAVWLSNPFNLLLLGGVLTMVVIVVLAITAPELFIGLFALLGRKKESPE
jgi:hypothetical protein